MPVNQAGKSADHESSLHDTKSGLDSKDISHRSTAGRRRGSRWCGRLTWCAQPSSSNVAHSTRFWDGPRSVVRSPGSRFVNGCLVSLADPQQGRDPPGPPPHVDGPRCGDALDHDGIPRPAVAPRQFAAQRRRRGGAAAGTQRTGTPRLRDLTGVSCVCSGGVSRSSREPVHSPGRPARRGPHRSWLASRGPAAYSLRSPRDQSPPRVPRRIRPPARRPRPGPADLRGPPILAGQDQHERPTR